MKRIATIALTIAALLLPSAAFADDLWLHVKVDEKSGEASRVTVNLPFKILEAAIPMIPEEALDESRLALDDAEITIDELRNLWTEFRNTPDVTLVTVEEDDQNVRVYKEKGYLMVKVTGSDESVDVRVPEAVVDALLSGEGNQLNLSAALKALGELTEGDLVTVNDGESHVRVWVDRIAEAR